MAKDGKRSGAGRPPGALNKTNAKAKAAIEECFSRLGGVDSYVQWARENPSEFYNKHFTRLCPTNVEGSGADGSVIVQITRFAEDNSAE